MRELLTIALWGGILLLFWVCLFALALARSRRRVSRASIAECKRLISENNREEATKRVLDGFFLVAYADLKNPSIRFQNDLRERVAILRLYLAPASPICEAWVDHLQQTVALHLTRLPHDGPSDLTVGEVQMTLRFSADALHRLARVHRRSLAAEPGQVVPDGQELGQDS
jgi:hypothetical protein